MTSKLMKQSENIVPQGVPVLKSKTGILSTVTNKDIRITEASLRTSKPAIERQRENASKLASGLSVVAKVDKENDVPFKKPVKAGSKLPQRPKKLSESKQANVKRSDSIVSVYQQEMVRLKEKQLNYLKPALPVPRVQKFLVNKEEQKTRTVANAFKVKEEKCMKPVEGKVEEKEVKLEVKEEGKDVKEYMKQNEIKEKGVKEAGRDAKEDIKENEIKENLKSEEVEEQEEKKEELLLRNVNIIDKDEDVQNPEFMLGLYAQDIFSFLRELEKVQSIRKNYLTTAHIMTQNMRTVLVDWIFEVQQSFRLLNETIQLAIALLDRFMQDHPNIVKEELQLVATACIFLAAKYEEMYPPDLEDFVNITANAYTKLEILKMEKVIFAALDFQMGRPLPSQFLRRYGRAGNVDFITYSFSKYFIDLSLVNYTVCHVRPSFLAAASLYLSLYLTSDSDADFWTPTLIYYTEYSAKALKPLVSKIASIVLEVPNSKYRAVPTKYLDPKRLHNVSARSELKSDKLVKIAHECGTYF